MSHKIRRKYLKIHRDRKYLENDNEQWYAHVFMQAFTL